MRQKREEGFTLIEVVASLLILSIVSLAMTNFFVQSMSYAKGNQQKTVMVNLARNALFYIEKQNFSELESYFTANTANKTLSCDISATACSIADLPSIDIATLKQVLNPTINGIEYSISITYQSALRNELDAKIKTYLLPINVDVYVVKDGSISDITTRLEGYITDDSIR